jgi:hypothetical protein
LINQRLFGQLDVDPTTLILLLFDFWCVPTFRGIAKLFKRPSVHFPCSAASFGMIFGHLVRLLTFPAGRPLLQLVRLSYLASPLAVKLDY